MTEPEAELGVAVPVRQILVSKPDVAAALLDCVAYSTGFKFSIALRTKNEITPEAMGFPMRPFQVESPTERFHFRVRFADGSDSGAVVGMQHVFRDYFEAIQEGREPVIPAGPVVSPRSGGGGGRRWDFGYWVWPLPPDGPITFTFEWPQHLDGEVTADVDGTAIRQAGVRSEKLW